MSRANGSARAVSKELNPETARQLRSLQQSHDQLSSRLAAVETALNAMQSAQPKPSTTNLEVTGTQAFILRNRT